MTCSHSVDRRAVRFISEREYTDVPSPIATRPANPPFGLKTHRMSRLLISELGLQRSAKSRETPLETPKKEIRLVPERPHLTNRDLEILVALTHRVRVFTISQIGQTWWATSTTPAQNATARLRILQDENLIRIERLPAHPEIPLKSAV